MVLALGGVVEPWQHSGYRQLGWSDVVAAVALAPLAAAAGVLIGRRPRSALGPLLAVIAVLFAVGRAADAAVQLSVSRGGSDSEGWRVNLAALGILSAATLALTFGTLLLPDGRLPSPRWRPVAWVSAVAIGAYLVGVLRVLPEPVNDIMGAAGWFAVLGCAVVCLGSAVVRWRRGRTADRAALAVVLGAGALPTLTLVLLAVVGEEDSRVLALPWLVCFSVLLPVSVLMAALVQEPLMSPPLARRVVLGALTTGGVIAGFAAAASVGVAAAHSDLGVAGGVGVALLTLLALSWPARLLRTGVGRLLYGQRDNPYPLVRQLAARVGAGRDEMNALHGALLDLRSGLRISSAGVHTGAGAVLAEAGVPVQPVHRVPLAAAGAAPGWLVLGARSPGESLTPADQDVLAAVAPHITALASASLQVEELRDSRTRIVLAREEERRRLRRDLHDGLGAALSGIGYGLDAAAAAGPDETTDRLRGVRLQLTAAQAELRRIIEDLRPSILDTSGLAEAVRAEVLARRDGRVQIETDIGPIGALPAALELAAYRVVQEAVTNALRHAQPARIEVGLHHTTGTLTATIRDDGVGIARDQSPGVGLTSMAERVAEVGGTLAVTPARPGTLVSATFPVSRSQQDGTSSHVPTGDDRT
jgi:signal transduction histidine kinase